jgi:riboflavin biosynthesis pyrimidine reductase
VRVLLHDAAPSLVGREVDVHDLPRLYAPPAGPWLSANMISTLDGAATGPDGRSGTINNEVDHQVFGALRRAADVVVVGAGTARAEGYSTLEVPLALATRSGKVPPALRSAEAGRVLLCTCAESPGLDEARELLGHEHVVVAGEGTLDLEALRAALHARGHRSILTEGGPNLLADLLAAGVVDELCLTLVPRLLGGEHRRVLQGPDVDVPLRPTLLLEHEGTMLGRWQVARR